MNTKSRLDAVDWQRVESELDAEGWSVLPSLIELAQCEALGRLWDEDDSVAA